jgi:hypothetical protein
MICENGKSYQHNHWVMDKPVTNPQYIQKQILIPGQRVFRDTTPEEARSCAIKRLQSAKGTQYEVEENSERWNELVESLTESFVGEPTVIKVEVRGLLP